LTFVRHLKDQDIIKREPDIKDLFIAIDPDGVSTSRQ
jgi:hypothetical protein